VHVELIEEPPKPKVPEPNPKPMSKNPIPSKKGRAPPPPPPPQSQMMTGSVATPSSKTVINVSSDAMTVMNGRQDMAPMNSQQFATSYAHHHQILNSKEFSRNPVLDRLSGKCVLNNPARTDSYYRVIFG